MQITLISKPRKHVSFLRVESGRESSWAEDQLTFTLKQKSDLLITRLLVL